MGNDENQNADKVKAAGWGPGWNQGCNGWGCNNWSPGNCNNWGWGNNWNSGNCNNWGWGWNGWNGWNNRCNGWNCGRHWGPPRHW